jgi:cold shock CspA family protein
MPGVLAPQSESRSQTDEGTVKDVLASQGFGFLKRDDGKPNVYFHCSDLVEALIWDKALRGRRVRFEIVETQKGARAVAVRKAE